MQKKEFGLWVSCDALTHLRFTGIGDTAELAARRILDAVLRLNDAKLPGDDHSLAAMAGMTTDKFRRHVRPLLAGPPFVGTRPLFQPLPDGTLECTLLRSFVERRRRVSAVRRAAAIKSHANRISKKFLS